MPPQGLDPATRAAAREADSATLRDLLLEVDRDGVRRSFLATEGDFWFVKALHARDRIVPIVGNLAGSSALAKIGKYPDATGLRVSAFYTSNEEFHLARLPRQPGSVIVRSVFASGGARMSQGCNSASVTQEIQVLLDGHQQGRFRQYWELVRETSSNADMVTLEATSLPAATGGVAGATTRAGRASGPQRAARHLQSVLRCVGIDLDVRRVGRRRDRRPGIDRERGALGPCPSRLR